MAGVNGAVEAGGALEGYFSNLGFFLSISRDNSCALAICSAVIFLAMRGLFF